jgi:tRNA threonylcarbamoyl adenosine modification protein YeaZ
VGRVFIVKTVLAIDTSTSRTSVVVIQGDSVLFSGHRDGATAHGPSLPALVQEALTASDVDEVVVGMGPGPFTGLRVGIAFAQSFALARQVPVRGVCSLDAIAAQIEEKDFIITVDARRKEVYWARYTDGIRIGEPAVSFPADVSGAPIHGDLFPDMQALVKLTGNIVEPIYLRRPDAVATVDRP